MNKISTYILMLALLVLAACDNVAITRSDNSTDYSYEGSTSVAGSLASFTISGNILYTINEGQLMSYDISNPNNDITVSKAYVKDNDGNIISNLETIFPYNDYLFLGATDGMYIVDVSTPEAPKFVSRYAHVVSCDPVVVQDSVAYVTLRDDNYCNQSVNELHVIDVSDVYHPVAIETYSLDKPYGLGVDGDLLFVCDDHKLKVLNCERPDSITSIEEFDEISANDVVPYDTVLMVLGEGELNQYSYHIGNLKKLSSIKNY